MSFSRPINGVGVKGRLLFVSVPVVRGPAVKGGPSLLLRRQQAGSL
jgi:hypothetical protein